MEESSTGSGTKINKGEETDQDVFCGRGKETKNHEGNQNFRGLVRIVRPQYVVATKENKQELTKSIVDALHDEGGRFLKQDPEDPGKWKVIGMKEALNKTSQALREGASNVRKYVKENGGPKEVAKSILKALKSSLPGTVASSVDVASLEIDEGLCGAASSSEEETGQEELLLRDQEMEFFRTEVPMETEILSDNRRDQLLALQEESLAATFATSLSTLTKDSFQCQVLVDKTPQEVDSSVIESLCHIRTLTEHLPFEERDKFLIAERCLTEYIAGLEAKVQHCGKRKDLPVTSPPAPVVTNIKENVRSYSIEDSSLMKQVIAEEPRVNQDAPTEIRSTDMSLGTFSFSESSSGGGPRTSKRDQLSRGCAFRMSKSDPISL